MSYEYQKIGPFGGNGGNYFGDLLCDIGTYVSSIGISAGGNLDRISMQCSNGKTIGPNGGSGGVPYTFTERDRGKGFRGMLTNTTGIVEGASAYYNDGKDTSSDYHGDWTGTTNIMKCRPDEVVVGYTGSSGSSVDRLGILCAPHPVLSCSKNPNTPYCKRLLLQDYDKNRSVAQDAIKTYCTATDFDQTCKDMLRYHQGTGDFDSFVRAWCVSHPGDPFCGCHQQLPPEAPEELRILSGQPQCYNLNCNTDGYQPKNIANDTRACPNIKICKQNSNVADNKTFTNNIIYQDCRDTPTSSEAPPVPDPAQDTPTSSEMVMTIVFIFLLVLVAALMGMAIAKFIRYVRKTPLV